MNDNEPKVIQLRSGAGGTGDGRGKLVMDASACRERAIADLKEASTMPTAKARRILESSAATWGARAALLDRMGAGRDRSAEADPSKER